MHSEDNMFSFEAVSNQHLGMIMDWLSSPHVMEFWDNSPEHKEDIKIFADGRKHPSPYFDGVFHYWIGKHADNPFCLVMTSEIGEKDDIPALWKDNLSKTGKNFSIDFCIGNTDLLGKGLASDALENFLIFFKSHIEPYARNFLIDPDENNPKAKHVYAKAGFISAGNFTMPSGFFSGHETNLMIKVLGDSIMTGLNTTNLTSLKKIYSGKVRDLYEIDEARMLMIATDRLSAFDVILDDPIPAKGQILTAISNFWFEKLKDVVPNHLTGDQPEDVVAAADLPQVQGRAVVAKRLKAVPIEAVVRGYLAGSGWKEYQQSGSICGVALPAGLKEADQLPEPIFTPSTKAAVGDHDENISFAQCEAIVGAELAAKVRDTAILLYKTAAEYAATRGIIICDTKFEFGLDENGVLTLMDEALTPDSSRFWPADSYQPGSNPPSFDKQFVRDWLEASGWNKQAPAPAVPLDVREKTAAKYREALERLTG
ncbi:phosphoribosylaminoimidazolesuccinocarboxamide synthase [Chromobacterium alticapitis]|uniref:Phosphoribosylaminoimidazole-succinocarboxamide synthase n=2 Tax=Chromobacterium alticapitis TaxID=2073169 RepID=A0A2S5DJ04_9NEIS|nr:phosphoribosylaminoimidazolesuccinocarboxamide synthase [Chromobacterium alticapitis]